MLLFILLIWFLVKIKEFIQILDIWGIFTMNFGIIYYSYISVFLKAVVLADTQTCGGHWDCCGRVHEVKTIIIAILSAFCLDICPACATAIMSKTMGNLVKIKCQWHEIALVIINILHWHPLAVKKTTKQLILLEVFD